MFASKLTEAQLRKVFTQRENYERLLADSEDRLAKVQQSILAPTGALIVIVFYYSM